MKANQVKVLTCILVFSILASVTVNAIDLEQWEKKSIGLGFNYSDIIVNDNGVSIIVGSDGNIIYSDDLVTQLTDKVSISDYQSCAWGNERFVVVGNYGHIVTSQNGKYWDLSFNDNSLEFHDVIYGDNGFIAVASSPDSQLDGERYVFHSNDGYVWDLVLEEKGVTEWGKVSYLNGQYILHDNLYDEFMISSDGITWSAIEMSNILHNKLLIWNGNEYISFGREVSFDSNGVMTSVNKVYSSTDLKNWTKLETNLYDSEIIDDIVEFEGGYIITCRDSEGSYLLKSNDLHNWEFYIDTYFNFFSSLHVGSNVLWAVGYEGTLVGAVGGEFVSLNSTNPGLVDIIISDDGMTALSFDGRVYKSKNGERWINNYIENSEFVTSGTYFENVYYTADIKNIGLEDQSFTVYSSSTGSKWEKISTIPDKNPIFLKHKYKLFLAYGFEGAIYWSRNAKSWFKTTTDTEGFIVDVEWFNGNYYALDTEGNILSSKDGKKWTSQLLQEGYEVFDIVTNGLSMMVVGNKGAVFYTEDGINWSSPEVFSGVDYQRALWDGESYVVFASDGLYFKTKDGLNMELHKTLGYKETNAVCWNGERYVILDNDGEISMHIPDEMIKVTIDDKPVIFDKAPCIINDRTMIPARAIFEQVGATVSWDGETRSVNVTKGDISIAVSIGSDVAIVNGDEKQLDSPAIIIDGRTYIPLRFVAEELGMLVEWDGDSRTVEIYQNY